MINNPDTPIRILIVDDHPVVLQGVGLIIKTQPDFLLIGEESTARGAINFLRKHPVDVILLDVRLPDEDGLSVLATIQGLPHKPSVIVLSSHDGEAVIGRAFGHGARGYVSKTAPAHELLEAIRAVAAGKRFISQDLAPKLADHTGRPSLSGRELAILELVAQGLGNRDIGRRLRVAEKTIKNQLTALFEKLEAVDRTHAVMIAVERGLIETAKS